MIVCFALALQTERPVCVGVACKSGFQATLLERLETGICRQQADATSAARLAQSYNKSASLGCSNNKLVEV